MAEIAVGAAIGAGFGLIRRKPLAILAWGLLLTLAFAGLLAAYVGFFANVMSMAGAPIAGPNAGLPPEFLGHMLMAEGGFLLAVTALVVLMTVVKTAIWRAVLHPDQAKWGYLRVGLAELFNLAVSFAVSLIANVIVIPLMPFVFIIGALVAFHQYVAAVIVGVLVWIAMIAAIVYLQLRFVLLGPMVVDDGKVHFIEAWRLSRGNVWRLFLVGLGMVAILFGAELLIEMLVVGSGAAAVGLAAGGFDKVQAFFEMTPAVIAGRLWPLAVIWLLAAVPLSGCLSAIGYAPWARAYRDLAPSPAETTFA